MARSMMREDHITLIVRDWPVFRRTMTICLDRSLYPTPTDLSTWARRRFGPGELRRESANGTDEHWEYRRKPRMARGLLRLFTFLLNRSYD
jgi:hypothetical protein